jgi:hypothetical protein
MTRSAPTAMLAGLAFAVLAAAPLVAPAASTTTSLQVPAGARIGVVSVLDAEVTHFHASRQIENSFLKTYPLGWRVNAMLLAAVQERLAQLGLVAVPLEASDDLMRARENCFLDASYAKGLPRPCERPFAQFAAAGRLEAIIVLGPGRNDSAHADGDRHRELPEYLRGWCFVTGKGAADAAPPLLDLTELLLLGVHGAEVRLADRQWGGEAGSWSSYRPPPDLKAIPNGLLDELQPLFGAALQRQAEGLVAHLQVAR